MLLRTMVVAAVLVASTGCNGDDAAGPSRQGVNGVEYSAEVAESLANNGRIIFAVLVTLRNVSTTEQTRTYPLGCAVQIRLYSMGGTLKYDESHRGCTPPDSATIVLPPGAAVTLTSGLRFPTNITDSLSAGEYDVRAWVRAEATGPIEVRAQRYTIPLYPY